jgi:RNA recognition motif-containing protein
MAADLPAPSFEELLQSDEVNESDVAASSGGVSSPAADSASTGALPKSKRVFVGNLSYRVSWQTLKDHMRQAGEVAYANVFMNERGQSRGCGVVEYDSVETAARAIQTLHDSVLEDRRIFVREDREDRESRPPRRFGERGGDFGGFGRDRPPRGDFGSGFHRPRPHATPAGRVTITNLPPNTDWRDLKDHFRRFGTVLRADINLSGEGQISFASATDAQAAVERGDNTIFHGQTINVRLA